MEKLRELAKNEEGLDRFSLIIEAIKELGEDKKFLEKLKKAEGISIRFIVDGETHDLLYDGKIKTKVDEPDATIKLNERAMRMLFQEPLRDLYLNQDISFGGNLKKAVKLKPALSYLLKEIKIKKP